MLRGPAEGGKREGLRCCSSQPPFSKRLPVRTTRASAPLSTRCSVLNWWRVPWLQEGGELSLEPGQLSQIAVSLQPMTTATPPGSCRWSTRRPRFGATDFALSCAECHLTN